MIISAVVVSNELIASRNLITLTIITKLEDFKDIIDNNYKFNFMAW